jgi:hypothetical protein
MQRIKLLGLAVLAVFAFSAVASAVASAEIMPPLMLPGAGTTFTIKGLGEPILVRENGEKIKCKKSTGSGEATSDSLGNFKILFEECKSEPLSTTCTGLGNTTGTILTEGEYHFRWLLAEKTKPHLVLLPKHVHFSCSLLLFLVLGCVASKDLEKDNGTALLENELVELFLVKLTQAGAVNSPSEVDTANGEGMEACGLKVKKGSEEKEEKGGEEASGVIEEFMSGGKKVSILLMP